MTRMELAFWWMIIFGIYGFGGFIGKVHAFPDPVCTVDAQGNVSRPEGLRIQ